MARRRYDVYGFRNTTLDAASKLVERALGIPLELRESSYRGIYYCGGPGIGQRFLLQENDEASRWHVQFGEFGVTLMISEQADMDSIRERFAAQGEEPVLLRTIVHADEEPNEDDGTPSPEGD